MATSTVATAAESPVSETGQEAVASKPRVNLTYLLVAVAGYAFVRLLGLIALYASPNRGNRSMLDRLSSWDGKWLLGIAQHGYDHGPVLNAQGELTDSNLAFFPLMPGLIRLVSLTGLTAPMAGVVIALVAGLAAAAGIYRLGEVLHTPATGVILALCWSMLPHAIVESMVYTEALFTALVAWTLLAVVRRHWLTAGLLCIPAGLARPTATALIGTVGLVAIVALFRRQDGWRPWVAMVLAPLGLVGYWLWVAERLGRIDGWFWVQEKGWYSHFDGGQEAVQEVFLGLAGSRHPMLFVTSLVTLIFAGLTLSLVFDREGRSLPIVIFGVAFFVLIAGTAGSYHSKGRLFLPDFVALIPVARVLATTRTVNAVVWLCCLGISSVAFGSYLLTMWGGSP